MEKIENFYSGNPTDVLYKLRYTEIPATRKQLTFDLLIVLVPCSCASAELLCHLLCFHED